jgi:tetratricopeptide (TPR) repeat protein
VRILLLLILIAAGGKALAFNFQPNPTQFALLPEHCKARLVDFYAHREGRWRHKFPINERKVTQYRRLIGSDFMNMHHYCAGLVFLSEAQRNPKRAKSLFKQAKGEIDYTLKRSNPKQPLWIEMSIAQAKTSAGLGQTQQALAQLRELLKLQPDNETVYLEIAKIQKRTGRINDAIFTLEAGIRNNAKEGPMLFFLADYYWDLGDVEKARALTVKAEAAGMKMERMREKLGME